MDEKTLANTLKVAALGLLKKQPDFFKFTSETYETEWNIAHHYALEVSLLFPEYSCDIDLIKPNYENKRPDIVLHTRGTNDDNFLVIEVKRDKGDTPADLEKIKNFWFRGELRYQFGAVVVINEAEEPFVHVLENTLKT